MASVVGMVNAGLLAVGANPILNLTENSKAGRWAQQRYADILDAFLAKHPWNFATTRAVLAPAATAPLFEWTYKHPLPADYIRLVPSKYLEDLNGPHKIENGHVLADTDTFYLKYVFRQLNLALYPPLFAEALGAQIGAECVIHIANDKALFDRLIQRAEVKLREARFVDATEDVPDEVEADAWTGSRY